jgi:hypothetical protein
MLREIEAIFPEIAIGKTMGRLLADLLPAGASKSPVQRKAPRWAGPKVESLNQQHPNDRAARQKWGTVAIQFNCCRIALVVVFADAQQGDANARGNHSTGNWSDEAQNIRSHMPIETTATPAATITSRTIAMSLSASNQCATGPKGPLVALSPRLDQPGGWAL